MAIHSEFFGSQREAWWAGYRLQRRHGFTFTVIHAMRVDMNHDWLLEVYDPRGAAFGVAG